MSKFYLGFAALLNLVAMLGGIVGVWLTWLVFRDVSQGGQPELISMVFAIGLATIPYCLAGSVGRLLAIDQQLKR